MCHVATSGHKLQISKLVKVLLGVFVHFREFFQHIDMSCILGSATECGSCLLAILYCIITRVCIPGKYYRIK